MHAVPRLQSERLDQILGELYAKQTSLFWGLTVTLSKAIARKVQHGFFNALIHTSCLQFSRAFPSACCLWTHSRKKAVNPFLNVSLIWFLDTHIHWLDLARAASKSQCIVHIWWCHFLSWNSYRSYVSPVETLKLPLFSMRTLRCPFSVITFLIMGFNPSMVICKGTYVVHQIILAYNIYVNSWTMQVLRFANAKTSCCIPVQLIHTCPFAFTICLVFAWKSAADHSLFHSYM